MIGAGEAVKVFGRLACQGEGAAGQTVTVYRHEAGNQGFAIVGTASSEPDGSYQLTPAGFDANSVLYARSVHARSVHVAVKVTPQVTLAGSPQNGAQLIAGGAHLRAQAASNNAVGFSGTVSPAAPGTTVALQRESVGASEGWRRIALGDVGPAGEYSLTHAFTTPGAVNIRVVVRQRGKLAVASEVLSYVITRRQNPLLTIASAGGLAASGDPVTIGGHAAGVAGQTVTLSARDHAGKFAALAQTATDDSGDYSFTAQKPLQSTLYRVSCAGRNSTVLPVRVTYALSAVLSASTIEAGQPISVSGAALPGQPGQPVYLERENRSGIGFHVVEVGVLGPGSSYSINHVFFSASDEVMRVKVPGAPGYAGVASEPFKVQVTPAPAVMLVTQAPGSTLEVESPPT